MFSDERRKARWPVQSAMGAPWHVCGWLDDKESELELHGEAPVGNDLAVAVGPEC